MAWHARLSASQTKDWANCPGIIPLGEMFPRDDPSGKAAQLGTCAHALIERCLGDGVPPSAFLGRLIEIIDPDGPNEGTSILKKGARWPKQAHRVVFEVDDEMVSAATSFVDYVLRRLCELLPDVYCPRVAVHDEKAFYAWGKLAVERGELKLEGRVNPLPDRDDTGGTADVTIDVWPDCLEIADYKNGTGVFVPVERNWQTRSYLLGRAVEDDPKSLGSYAVYRHSIGQPRHHLSPEGGVSHEEMDEEDVALFQRDLLLAVKRVDEARAYMEEAAKSKHDADGGDLTLLEAVDVMAHGNFLSAGEDGSHCKYCPHKTYCPAARLQVQESAATDFEEEGTEEDMKPPEDPEHIANVIRWAPYVRDYLKACEEAAQRLLLDGTRVPGYKMVRKQGNRRFKAEFDDGPDTLADAIVAEYGVKREELFDPPVAAKLKSGPAIKKLVPSDKREEFDEAYLFRPNGGLDMVPESDKRKAVDGRESAAADFEEDDE